MAGYTPTGTYNDDALSDADKKKVQSLKDQYNYYTSKGDKARAAEMHDAAEEIRKSYGYSGGGDGSEYIPIAAETPVKQSSYTAAELPSASSQEDYIKELYAAQQEANLQALKTAYDENVLTLDKEAEKIPEYYRAAENQTSGQYEIARKSMNEQLNASGLNTGAGSQAALSMQNQHQSNMSDLENARASAMAEVEGQRAQLETEYKNAVAQAIKEGNLAKAQALYSEAIRVDESLVATALNQADEDYRAWAAAYDLENSYQSALKENRAEAQAQVEAILKLGGTPSAGLIEASGYSDEYINALRGRYGGAVSGTSTGSTANSKPLTTITTNYGTFTGGEDTTIGGMTLAEYDRAEENYDYIKATADLMVGAGKSSQEILNMLEEYKDAGELTIGDYINLVLKYR